jgi:ferric-dicitrate binding protein FerR (iron transport regulator)
MFKADLMRRLGIFAATVVAAALIGSALVVAPVARAGGGGCALVANEHDPSEKILRCGDSLTVQPAHGTHYRLITKGGQPLPSAIRLDDGALLIEFHPSPQQEDFQILTPLAVAAVRGTKWAMEVSPARTSTLVLAGAVAVTNRRLNEYVILREGEGVDITPSDTTMVQKRWGAARVRALLSRFGQ